MAARFFVQQQRRRISDGWERAVRVGEWIDVGVSRTLVHIHTMTRWSACVERPEELLAFARACDDAAHILGAVEFIIYADNDALDDHFYNCSTYQKMRERAIPADAPIMTAEEAKKKLPHGARCIVVRSEAS